MKTLAVGDKVRMMWPKDRPMMCVVGFVEDMHKTAVGLELSVRYADDKQVRKVLADVAKVWSASKQAKCGLWARNQA